MVSTPSSTLTSTLLLSTPGISTISDRAWSVSKMSVVGTKNRAGTVDSCFFSSSRFCWTCSSCGDMFASVIILCLDGSVDADAAGLVAFGPRDEERKNAIAIFGLDAVGIDLDRHGQGAIEGSGQPLTPA